MQALRQEIFEQSNDEHSEAVARFNMTTFSKTMNVHTQNMVVK